MAAALGSREALHASVSGRSPACQGPSLKLVGRGGQWALQRSLHTHASSALVFSAVPGNSDPYEQQSTIFERQASYLDNPERQQPEREPTLVRVRLSVHYRVHSRQMLAIGGSQMPFGWSFLSIAKVPMTWNQGDIWTCEVLLPAGQRIEYKYVIMEEQDWTKLENEDAEGLVDLTYRSGTEPGKPPDVQIIQKQMAIVAWQPGPNRVVQVPTESELQSLVPGAVTERVPARPNARVSYETERRPRRPDPFEGTWEILALADDGSPLLDRHDVWGWTPPVAAGRPPPMRGLRFDS